MPDFGGPGLFFPQPTFIVGTSSTALTSSSTIVANVIIGAMGMTVDRIKFYVTAVTTSDQIRASLQQVGSAGNPSGTILASGLYTPTAVGLHTVTLNQSVNITDGSRIAVVLDYYSSNVNITLPQVTFNDPRGTSTYAAYYSTSWTKQTRNFILYATNSSGVPLLPTLPYISTATFNVNSNPDEYGVRITMPFDATIIGGWLQADLDAAADLAIYTPGGTQYTASADANVRPNANVSIYHFYCTPFNVAANQQVIVSVIPTTTTNIVAYLYNIAADATSMPYMCPGYEYIQGVQRTDSGSWSTNSRPLIGGVIIGSITATSGGISRARVQGRM